MHIEENLNVSLGHIHKKTALNVYPQYCPFFIQSFKITIISFDSID